MEIDADARFASERLEGPYFSEIGAFVTLIRDDRAHRCDGDRCFTAYRVAL